MAVRLLTYLGLLYQDLIECCGGSPVRTLRERGGVFAVDVAKADCASVTAGDIERGMRDGH